MSRPAFFDAERGEVVGDAEMLPMNPLEMIVGMAMAALLLGVAGYFAWRQRSTLRMLHADADVAADQRRYLLKQCWRRLFGSALLVLMAAMLFGSVYLDYEPLRANEVGPASEEAKSALRFLSFYWMTLLFLLMVLMTVAVVDLWATARFSVQQQKQLAQEHQRLLEAELAQRKRQQQTEMN